MEKVISEYLSDGVVKKLNVPIKLWVDDIEDNALDQAKNLARLPFVFKHIAVMPDSHLGYGMPIGGVMATKGVIIPNCIGVDIGCGMCAVKTNRRNISQGDLKTIMGAIRDTVPVGFNHHKKDQDFQLMPDMLKYNLHLWPGDDAIFCNEYSSAIKQLGTLGSGNHFIEIQKGDDGFVWIMIHSGSRNLGLKVAKHYNNIAIELNEKWHSVVPKKWQLAFLPLDTREAEQYMNEMQYCVDFALANRKLMMQRVQNSFLSVDQNMVFDDMINIAHNYAAMENHFGQNVLVHRKGATQAREGQLGIIPGSQGSKSYIVQGKGEKESFMSCSHGAGRKMGRKYAIEHLDLNTELKKMEGILHSIRGKKDLDEADGAYKNIDAVMKNQEDLVDIIVELRPLGVIKG